MQLEGENSYYMIVSPFIEDANEFVNQSRYSELQDVLYRKEYNIAELLSEAKKSCLVTNKSNDNNTLRYDAIELLDRYNQKSVVVKYNGDESIKKIFSDGSERRCKIVEYNYDKENSYHINGIAFSVIELEDYYLPRTKTDIKDGMVVEIKNNYNQWVKREVSDINEEWESFYKLLVKYDKLRIIKRKL